MLVMNKIDELIEKIRQRPSGWDTIEFFEHDIEMIMIEYAEYYANKCLAMIDNLPQEIPIGCFQLPEHD